MPRRVGSSLAPLQRLKAKMIRERRAREGTSWDCTELGTGRFHYWCRPLMTLLRWAEFELLTSKGLAPSMKSVIVTLQPLIIQALGGKCSYLCWTCFWATEYYVLRCNFASVSFYPTASSLTSADLISILLPFTNSKPVLSLPCFLFCMSGPCCYPLVFLQLVFNLSYGDKVSSYHHNPQVHHQKNCCVRHNVDQHIRNFPVLSSHLQGLKHY